MTHMPPPLAITALNLVSIMPPSGLGLVVCGCITILIAALPLGSLTTVAGTLTIPPLTPIGTLSLFFLFFDAL